MPRHERNNPFERIGRLLQDYEELAAWAADVEQKLAQHDLNFFRLLPAKPTAIHIMEERLRRELTGATVVRNREATRRYRLRLEKQLDQLTEELTVEDLASHFQSSEGLTEEDKARIEEEMK